MTRVPISFGTGTNPGRTGFDGAALLLNCYAENAGKEGKIPFPIYPIPGLTLWGTAGASGGGRGLHVHDTDELLAVLARVLYSYDPLGTETEKGGIASDGLVTFATNRASLKETAIVCDGLKFIYSDGGLTAISDTDLPPPISCDIIDGYMLYFLDSGQYYFSEIDDAGNIDALSFVEAEGAPDGLVRGKVRDRVIYLFGTRTTELHAPTGNVDAPFARLPGAFFQFGCAAAASVAAYMGGVAFVSAGEDEIDGQVRVIYSDGSTRRISNHAVERDISDLSDRTILEAEVHSFEGHDFYCLSSASWTWTFDTSTGEWHKRESYQKDRWRCSWHALFNDQHIFTDFESAKLYVLDKTAEDENGEPIMMRVRAPIVHAYPDRLAIGDMRFDIIPGQGLASGDDDQLDPQAMFRYSKDGGNSWSSERTMSIGKIGERKTRAKIHRLGMTDEDGIIPEITMSAAVQRGLTGASMDVERLEG